MSDLLRPFAFLSSASADLEDLRPRLYEREKHRLWIAEEHAKEELDPKKTPPFVILDALVKQARESRAFVCVLKDDYGSSVFKQHAQFYGQESVSFLEVELCLTTQVFRTFHARHTSGL